ncbi:alpha-amylase 3, chloroplastic isoform X2 [Andrographis paniculata]|uniref:alpha-amylase 3, chloroplastic isoform X2 n=1 Tax=Andrographis paniculata TaxID=175694 RepID=UPI0021E9263B|nr:alpha-amylase 3, chloroplastic isoform X2 [Andrographis paniculata]
MAAVTTDLFFTPHRHTPHHHRRRRAILRPVQTLHLASKKPTPFHLTCRSATNGRGNVCFLNSTAIRSSGATAVETSESSEVTFSETFDLKRAEKLEGKITIRLDSGENEENMQLIVGCSLLGKWVLHWGVHYLDDVGSEWDQPPLSMRPPGSVPIKDYAIETPFEKSSALPEEEAISEVKIDINKGSSIAAINFVLKDEESGHWYQHRGRDFRVPLIGRPQDDGNVTEMKKNTDMWSDALGQISNLIVKPEASDSRGDQIWKSNLKNGPLQGVYEEHPVFKEVFTSNSISVSVRHCPDVAKNIVYLETDLPGDVVVHWGVCRDEGKSWEIPAGPYPSETSMFRNKALRTLLQKEDGCGAQGSFTLDEGFVAFVYVLKLKDNTWLNWKGNDFYIPLETSVVTDKDSGIIHSGNVELLEEFAGPAGAEEDNAESNVTVSSETTDILNEIRSLVTDIATEKSRKTKSKEAQESILHEIEKLAAEAYSIFQSTVPKPVDTDPSETESSQTPVKISSGTGSGFEILCQGFNWESHKSGNWYMELYNKASDLSSFGFTVIWLPPPTDSVSPEGYMPRDLYNLNSRYGNMDQLKTLVERLHEVGITVLGDVVLNHRCAQYKNSNGVWNIFGGRLNWDDRAVVSDDPHFQGRGNKSSGDSFHAAPNIDHSQEFVRKDIKEWLQWLRKEIGYDGWRLDFVRGFWGGYVKDYLEATEPYFAVGEFWDSLSYTYGEMDHNQDAHRQRIVDWINATNGTAGAFDVTTKGILHSALERCEYWRLSDQKGKPPGVVGWWPSRAVTFIENHDTGSTQGHWRFPGGKEMQGYAYILTHPGTPSVFYDHIFSEYQSEIAALMSIRKRKKIHCRSTVKIVMAERDVYAAIIDDKLAMKIGPGHFEPSTGSQNWSLAIEGRDYKVWETS